MNDDIKKKVKRKIAIHQIKKEQENSIINGSKKFIFKNIGITIGILISLTGVVFASHKVIETIWEKPEKIDNITDQITAESQEENITEEQAKTIAMNKLKEIKFNTNIISTNHYKELDSNTIMYRFITEDNYEISINGTTGEFYSIWNNNDIQDRDIEITEDEAKKVADEYYKLFGFKEGEYKITKIWVNNKERTGKDKGFKIDITYNKTYGETYNPYENISIGIESKNKELEYFRVENIPFDNNEIKITKEDAIQIALEEDKKIGTTKIVDTQVKQMIVKMNTDAYDRIHNYEEYYKSMQSQGYNTEDKNYYDIKDKVRNAWVVVITYEDNFDNVIERYTEGKYSYFIDCTTGEIIGGHSMDYTYSN